MTNLENHLGLRLFITQDSDPNFITSETNLLSKLVNIPGFNANEFFIYTHTITFYRVISKRKKSISKLVDNLFLSFGVNPKQKQSDSVRFYNELLIEEDNKIEGITEYCEGIHSFHRIFEGVYLDQHDIIKSKLITYVSKKLVRKDHRKIKITIKFTPKQNNRNSNTNVTAIDLSLDSELLLNFRGLTPTEINEVHNKILGHRPIKDMEVDAKKIIKENLLFQTEIDERFNDLRDFCVTEKELQDLREIVLKYKSINTDSDFEKKISNWLAKLSKRSIGGANLKMDDITGIVTRVRSLTKMPSTTFNNN